jgi:hypothetical protein
MIKFIPSRDNNGNFENKINYFTLKGLKNLENQITSTSSSFKKLPMKMIKFLSITVLYNKIRFKYTKGKNISSFLIIFLIFKFF